MPFLTGFMQEEYNVLNELIRHENEQTHHENGPFRNALQTGRGLFFSKRLMVFPRLRERKNGGLSEHVHASDLTAR